MIKLQKYDTPALFDLFENFLFSNTFENEIIFDFGNDKVSVRGLDYRLSTMSLTDSIICNCPSTPSNPTTGVTLQIDDTVYALCGTKTVINNNEILTIPINYEYRCSSLTNEGIINNNGIIILN